MRINDVFSELNSITLKLIELGLSVQQNFPHRSGNLISCKESADISNLLRNISYSEKYDLINKENIYNVKLLDGALLQLMYAFTPNGRELVSHRLAYFPAPHLPNYENEPEDYESKYFGESEFHDLIEKDVIKTPIRFDFNIDASLFKEIHHPYSHLHLGEYESCRMPVYGPVCPSAFVNFILRNFYNSALVNYCNNYSFTVVSTDRTITNKEANMLHISFS